MSRSVNKIMIIGNVGSDPNVNTTGRGTKVANFSVATNRRPHTTGATERTDWHKVTVWGELAKFVEDFVVKGDRVYIEGQMFYDSYERNGITIPTAEITADRFIVLDSKRSL